MKSLSDDDSDLFQATDHELASVFDEQINHSEHETHLRWNEKVLDSSPKKVKTSGASDPSVTIRLNDVDVESGFLLKNAAHNSFSGVRNGSEILSLKQAEMEYKTSNPISTSKTELNSSQCKEIPPVSTTLNFGHASRYSPNKFIPTFPISCTDFCEENIALSGIKSASLDNRCSLPLAKITDYSSSGEVI